MNIVKFIDSLDEFEIDELRKCLEIFLIDERNARVPITEFVKNNKMSVRLKNTLLSRKTHWSNPNRIEGGAFLKDDGLRFNYLDEVEKVEFRKVRGSGRGTWLEFEKIISSL